MLKKFGLDHSNSDSHVKAGFLFIQGERQNGFLLPMKGKRSSLIMQVLIVSSLQHLEEDTPLVT